MNIENIEDSYSLHQKDCSSDSVDIEIVLSNSAKRKIAGRLGQFTGHWLFLDVNERIASSAAVCVAHGDILIIGEVLACQPAEDGSWQVRVEVKHTLTNLQSLMHLRAALVQGHVHSLSTITL